MNETGRREHLVALGLDPDGDTLAGHPEPAAQPVPQVQGPDPHTMPVTDIEFTDDMLDGYDLDGPRMRAASEHLFNMFRSPGKDPERHALLHRRITEFIGQVRRSRATNGAVRERVKVTAQERELAQLLAAKGLTVEELAALIETKGERT